MTENKKHKREQLDDKEIESLFLDIDKFVDHAKSQIKEKKARVDLDFVRRLRKNLEERIECATEDLEVQSFDGPWGSLTNIEFDVSTYDWDQSGNVDLKFTDALGTNWRLRALVETKDSEITGLKFQPYHQSPRRIRGEPFTDELRTLLVHIIYEHINGKPSPINPI